MARTGNDNEPALARALHEALITGAVTVCGTVTIGGLRGWATQLLEPLDKLEAALGELKNLDGPSFAGPGARLTAIRKVIERCKVVEQNTSRVESTFLQKLNGSNLNRALNEVMALFTPVPWAYHDVKVTYAQGPTHSNSASTYPPAEQMERPELQSLHRNRTATESQPVDRGSPRKHVGIRVGKLMIAVDVYRQNRFVS